MHMFFIHLNHENIPGNIEQNILDIAQIPEASPITCNNDPSWAIHALILNVSIIYSVGNSENLSDKFH